MHVSSLKGGVKNGEQEKIQRRFEEEIRRTQIQQEGQPGSPHRNASHALWQTQSKEPQAGHCHRSFQSAAKRRQGSKEKSSLIRTNLFLLNGTSREQEELCAGVSRRAASAQRVGYPVPNLAPNS